MEDCWSSSVGPAGAGAKPQAGLGGRDRFTGEDDFVFSGKGSILLNADSLSKRYEDALQRAGLHRLRVYDLRHTFSTRVIAEADIRQVQDWMGRADIQTHHEVPALPAVDRDAELVAAAFVSGPSAADAPRAG
jgi:integrase